MSQPALSDDQMQQALELVKKHGGISQAARAVGVPVETLRGRYNRAKIVLAARQIQQNIKDSFPPAPVCPEGFEIRSIATGVDDKGNTKGQWIGARLEGSPDQGVPDGHFVKGLSTLLDESGKVRAQWVKTSLDQDKFRAMTEAACRAAAKDIKPVKRIAAPRLTSEDLLTLYTATDSHVGMLAWGKETGEPWDLQIAERVLCNTFAAMIDGAPASEIGILNQLGDFLHFDSLKPLTPEHGNVLDADSRYQKIVEIAVKVLRYIIERMLTKHKKVVVYMHEGNHDPAGSVWLRVLFAALYANNPRVTVEQSPLPYVAFQHGKTMLCFHHGHLSKNESLPLVFAARFSEMWGKTKKRYIHTGHRHSVDEKEFPGVKVMQHPTLAAADAYAARGGWVSERQATSVTYHIDTGEYARNVYLPVEQE